MDEQREWEVELTLPTAQQVAAVLAAAALAGPAMMGGMPVLPVTIEDERRRQQDEIIQESDSSVGAYQHVEEAATALALSQRRLEAATRDVEGTHARDVSEADVVAAAHKVAAGEASPHKSREFRAALSRVVVDSVDLFILLDDEAAAEEQAAESDEDDFWDEDDDWDEDEDWDWDD